jgi:hypothetical protein
VVVVRGALVTGMVVVVRMGSGMQFALAMLVLAFLRAMPVRVDMGVCVLVRMAVRVRVRVEQVAVPVPVLVLVRVIVRVLVQVIVRVAGGASGFVMRHGGLRETKGPRKLPEPARHRQGVLTVRSARVKPPQCCGRTWTCD